MWRRKGDGMVSMEAVKLDGPNGREFLFTLERRPSSLDDERGLRPFVYAVSPRGLEARWRGTALSRPLLDAVFLSPEGGILCALHRGDSFLNLDPGSLKTRTAVYRWNGFGFSGIEDPGLQKACEERFEPLGPDR